MVSAAVSVRHDVIDEILQKWNVFKVISGIMVYVGISTSK